MKIQVADRRAIESGAKWGYSSQIRIRKKLFGDANFLEFF